jgi:hypothetical protein
MESNDPTLILYAAYRRVLAYGQAANVDDVDLLRHLNVLAHIEREKRLSVPLELSEFEGIVWTRGQPL